MPRLNFDLPDDVHAMVKSAASFEGKTIRKWAADVLHERAVEVVTAALKAAEERKRKQKG